MSTIDRAEVAKLLDERIKPLESRVEKFLTSQEESRRVMERVLSRLTSVIAGDQEFGTEGLVGRVDAHEKYVNAAKEERSEIKGMIRSTLFIGGAVIVGINLIIGVLTVYLATNAK